jgi:hypothetical protein
VHDFNGGILPSGLFWVVELPDDAVHVSQDGRRATLEAHRLAVIDSFQFFGPNTVPATVSFRISWEATGSRQVRGRGREVPPTHPAAFLGSLLNARSDGWFSGSEIGFRFWSEPGADTDGTFAELGFERNGTFLP